MVRLKFLRVLGVCALGAALAACDATGTGGGDGASAPQATSSRAIERDVEAPSVFNMQDNGLWDGRPSLGGVWVAHPDVRDPERVIIRNPSTGREVVGALFRRERQNPGPVFQVSADAAAAVGMLAGQPAALSVTALRTQAAPEAPTQTAAATDPQTETAAEGAPDTETAAAPTERRGLGRLFGRSAPAASDAVSADVQVAAVPDSAAPDAATPNAATPDAPRRRLLPFGRRDAAAPEPAPGIETMSLDGDSQPAQSAPAPAPTATPAPAPSPAPATTIDRAFVQLGIFSVEENANRAVAQMRALGLQGNITPGQTGENRYWRVTVGPATSTAQRDQTLATVKAQGFQDAYVVAR